MMKLFFVLLYALFGFSIVVNAEDQRTTADLIEVNTRLSTVQPKLLPDSLEVVGAKVVFSLGKVDFILVDFKLSFVDPNQDCGNLVSVFTSGNSRVLKFNDYALRGEEFKLLKDAVWCSGSTLRSEQTVTFRTEIHSDERLKTSSNPIGLTNRLRFSGQETHEFELYFNNRQLENLLSKFKKEISKESDILVEINFLKP